MSIRNDKELFKLRDDILAGFVVTVTKDHFNKLESVAVSRSGLLEACKALMDDMSTMIQLVQNGHSLDNFDNTSYSKGIAAIRKATE